MPPCPLPRRRPVGAALLGLALAVLAPLLTAAPAPAAPEGPPGLVFVLDASASMATKVQGKPRMEGLKTVLPELIAGLPAGIEVGLVAFGHRQAEECSDVEELSALGPPDRPALSAKIQGLAATGKAPLRDALEKASAGLKDRAGKTTIVLVTDGGDRCGADPCALVKELKSAGTRFVLNVVALGVTGKARAPLACMAKAGGGTLYSATTPAELKRVLAKAVARTTTPTGSLKVKALRNGQPIGAWYDLYSAGRPRGAGQAAFASTHVGDQGATVKLVPGTYDLVIRDQEDRATAGLTFTGLKIAPGKTLEQTADFTPGSLTVRALRNGRPLNARYQLFRPGDATLGAHLGSPQAISAERVGVDGATIEVLPGTYDLVIENLVDLGQAPLRFDGIVIGPGQRVEKTGGFAGGTLKVIARRGGLPVRARFEVLKAAAPDAEPEPIGSDLIAAEGQRILLPPGTYNLRIRNLEDPGAPVIDFPAVMVEAAKTLGLRADF